MAMVTDKPRRPPRTFGEVARLPSGRFRARYWGPDGKRYNAPLTYVARTDAEGWLAAQERAISRGDWEPPRPEPASAPRPTFGDYARSVLKARTLRATTVELYDKLLRLAILPTFGTMPISAITPEQVTTWYVSLKATPTQQANAYGLMKSVLKQAAEERLITENPCRVRAGSQKRSANQIHVLTIAQLTAYIEAVPERHRIPLLLAGWCGLRSGEVRGLRLQDLDFENGVVHVRQAVARVKGELLIGPPKTRAGIRSVAIPPHLLPGLRVWLHQQADRPRGALAFTAADGVSPMNDTTLRRAHDRAKNVIGVPQLTIHALRHTSATIAAQLGATIAELQARIGHSTPTMAMRYQHVAAHRDAELAARISHLATEQPEDRQPESPRRAGSAKPAAARSRRPTRRAAGSTLRRTGKR